ncbi:murein biosynthesis integral membrane protein MurJ [Tissierella pigra]|uniref:murein biosynthesis integral membrane protein MurJ n=1 Tax=Tissierella pigra TaxID=2607614 RepID=UPI001C100A3E|nr:murein biosynthesis integral membrane protein MurJ [Tissierella pigra]MBU5427908.1 murein biosynthesis integral membrane protein MurJ [Tissierella pigra]
MSKSNKTVKSALIIIIFSLGSKFLGFIREVLIAAKFGSSIETDTFFIALSASALISGFLSNAISTTFIPVISEVESKKGKKGKIEHTNNMINVIFFVSLILLVIVSLGTPMLVKLLASGFEGKQFDLAVKLTRIGLSMILFSGVIGVMTGYLQSEQRFNATAMIGFPFNFVYIFFLLFLSSMFGIKGLMVAGVVATFSQLLVQIPEARASGFRYKFIFDIKDKYIRKVLYLSLPVLIGVAINDLNAVVDRTLASNLVLGSISALNYANKLSGLILGVFISAITTVIFPVLSKEANNENIDGVKSTMSYGINLILLITIPATVGMIVLAKPIVEIAFQRGEFDATATLMTSQALVFYSMGLVASSLRLLITRVYYSLQDTKTPMINGVISVGFNIILNLILVRFMAHAGLALATSIAITIATIMLLYGLKKKIGSLGTKQYITTFFKTGLASSIMGLVAYIAYNGLYGILGVSKLYNLMSLLVAVGLAVIVYGVSCYLFKIEEVRDAVHKIIKKL